ncbi:MAG: copper chaperone PCu(A)C [Novosphingobium sp.]
MRKLAIIGLSTLALTLAACGQKAEDPTAQASSSAAAGPESAPGVVVTDAMVRLPAVPGTPGAAYFTVSQGSGAPRKIAAIHVEGAERAEMHETVDKNGISSMQQVKDVPIEAGKSVQFKPGGLHVMLFDVADTLKAGTTTELTITLDNGDKASVPARVETLGGSGGSSGEAMEAMDHSGHDMSGHDMSKM